MALTLTVDLDFELARPGQATVTGRMRSEGGEIVLEVSDPSAFAGSGDASSIKAIAGGLAQQGMVVRVVHDGQDLVSIGAVSAPWWQRPLTGSRRIRMASLRGAWTSARANVRARKAGPILPSTSLLPPLPLFPLAPTLLRGPPRRRTVTTTHDPSRAGEPRLVLLTEPPREPVTTYFLTSDTTIGSDPAGGIVLAGLAPLHARLRHDDADEWVIDAEEGLVRVHGAPVTSRLLRTGSVVQVGPHRMAFYREEYADHGRPYGGRIGGELGQNTAQPERRVEPPIG